MEFTHKNEAFTRTFVSVLYFIHKLSLKIFHDNYFLDRFRKKKYLGGKCFYFDYEFQNMESLGKRTNFERVFEWGVTQGGGIFRKNNEIHTFYHLIGIRYPHKQGNKERIWLIIILVFWSSMSNAKIRKKMWQFRHLLQCL